MRIMIQTSSGEFDLCKGIAEDEHTQDLRINGKELLQVAQFLRATRGKAFPRGNTTTTVTFTVTREHADGRTCEEFIMAHHAAIPKAGDVLFIAEGSGQSRYKLSDAGLDSHEPVQIGVASIHRYVFIGGDFTEATS